MGLPLYLQLFCRIVIGLVFAVSFTRKVVKPDVFRQTISSFQILPRWMNGPASVLFLSGELAVVVLMCIGGGCLLPGFALAGGLLLLFCLALSSVLLRRIRTSCNCFGPTEKQISVADVWRNVGFILCACGGCGALLWSKQSSEAQPGLVEWGLAGLGACVFVIIWTQLGEIVQLLRQS